MKRIKKLSIKWIEYSKEPKIVTTFNQVTIFREDLIQSEGKDSLSLHSDIRDLQQTAMAADSMAVMVGEVCGEYITVARQNFTLSNAQREVVRPS